MNKISHQSKTWISWGIRNSKKKSLKSSTVIGWKCFLIDNHNHNQNMNLKCGLPHSMENPRMILPIVHMFLRNYLFICLFGLEVRLVVVVMLSWERECRKIPTFQLLLEMEKFASKDEEMLEDAPPIPKRSRIRSLSPSFDKYAEMNKKQKCETMFSVAMSESNAMEYIIQKTNECFFTGWCADEDFDDGRRSQNICA